MIGFWSRMFSIKKTKFKQECLKVMGMLSDFFLSRELEDFIREIF